ncbi:MAG: hypothetical protein HZB53_00655 [Chloroflexi bacterium]|nr:hypothetical protein [Chloroflexota bacterium]
MQKPGGIASLLNALIAVANLVIVFAVLGPALSYAPRDSIAATAALVKLNPAPLIALEVLKLLSAACGLVIVLAIRERMTARTAPNVRWAMLAGFAGTALLSLAGLVGVFAIAQAGRAGAADAVVSAYEELSAQVTYIGLFALLANGVWLLLTASAAIKRGGLPLRLAHFTFLFGALNVLGFLLPPLAIVVLLIGLVWNVTFGLFVLREGESA